MKCRSLSARTLLGTCTPFLVIGLFASISPGCRGKEGTGTGNVLVNSVGMSMVELSRGYYVSRYETRQSEFEAVMGYNPSTNRGPEDPVENITGDEAITFCKRLTEKERSAGKLPEGFVYELPTFRQWMEFSADASLSGSITPGGGKGTFKHPQPVGSGEVNRLGIYDIRGNVSEYSSDLYVSTGTQMILGADFAELRKDFLSVENKTGLMDRKEKGENIGFRCVLVPSDGPSPGR
jgi:hypothetical protein